MFEKIEIFDKRYSELNRKIYEPAVAADVSEYQKIMKEIRELEPVVLKYREYREAQQTIEESLELLSDPGADAELRDLARAELDESKKAVESLSDELKLLLLPKDPNDSRNVIVEIRGGAGGEESALFSAVLYRMYSMYAERRGFKTELINANETELGGYKEISFMIVGEGAYSRFKYESGVHRVQRVPETESQGRIHTSTTTVAVLPEAEEVEMEINPKNLKIDTFRSSGAGGQHINKTSSAIRITHLPTGTVVAIQNERSQLQNKEKALEILRGKLAKMKLEQAAESIDKLRAGESAKWGQQIRNYVLQPYKLVKDTRTKHEEKDADAVLDGKIMPFIDAYLEI